MKKLFITLILLSCASSSSAAASNPLAGRGATEVCKVDHLPCKISDFPKDPTSVTTNFKEKTLTLLQNSAAVDANGEVHRKRITLKLFPDKCRHDSSEGGCLNRHTSTPHCKECKKFYDEWLEEAEGTFTLLDALRSWPQKTKE